MIFIEDSSNLLNIENMKSDVPKIDISFKSQQEWTRELNTYKLKNVDLYNGYFSLNMENAWQYTKLYDNFIINKPSGMNPFPEIKDINMNVYLDWACNGWNKKNAERYPLGKNKFPYMGLHIWDNKVLKEIEARKIIYVPLYISCVIKTDAFKQLKEIYEKHKDICILDFKAPRLSLYKDDALIVDNNLYRQKYCYNSIILAYLLLGKIGSI